MWGGVRTTGGPQRRPAAAASALHCSSLAEIPGTKSLL
jgi:hypothetical protein